MDRSVAFYQMSWALLDGIFERTGLSERITGIRGAKPGGLPVCQPALGLWSTQGKGVVLDTTTNNVGAPTSVSLWALR